MHEIITKLAGLGPTFSDHSLYI